MLGQFNSSSESSDESEENENRRIIVRPRINFELDDFAERFRFSKMAVESILRDVGHLLAAETDRNFPLDPKEQLLLCIRYLASGSFMQIVGDAHGPHKSTVSRKVHKVVTILNEFYFDRVISWPEDIPNVTVKFFRKARMPCVVGCIDGTHIPIKSPSMNEPQYVNRKGVHSINCMMICGPDYKFYYVSSRWPGSVNDSRVLRNSNVARRFDDGWRPVPGVVLLGDSGYPNNEWLITPVIKADNAISQAEKEYNRAHRKTRRIVEQSFGILKQRFASLNKLRLTPEFAGEVIKLCCIFHNLLINREDGDETSDEDELFVESDVDVEESNLDVQQVVRRRDAIIHLFEIGD